MSLLVYNGINKERGLYRLLSFFTQSVPTSDVLKIENEMCIRDSPKIIFGLVVIIVIIIGLLHRHTVFRSKHIVGSNNLVQVMRRIPVFKSRCV